MSQFVDALLAAHRQYIAVVPPRADRLEVGPLAGEQLRAYLQAVTGGADPDPVAVAIADALTVVAGAELPANGWRILDAGGEVLSEGIVE